MTWRMRLQFYTAALLCCIAIFILGAFNHRPAWLHNLVRDLLMAIPDEALLPPTGGREL